MSAGENIRRAIRKAYLQEERITLYEVNERGLRFDITAKSDAMFTMLAVSVSHTQMAEWMARWFVHLPKREQERIIASMQDICEGKER